MRSVHALVSSCCGVALWVIACPAVAGNEEPPAPPVKVDSSPRFIPEAPVGPPLPIEELAPAEAETGTTTSHRRGGRPSTPHSKLPEGVSLSEPNAKARQSIAEGPTSEEIQGGPADDQLRALRDAERVLFPENVRGIEPSWSFEVPSPADEEGRALGLPLTLETDSQIPSLSKDDLNWLRSLTLPDLPVRLDRRVVTYLKFYRDSHRGRTIAAIWTRKSGRYVAEIKAKLRRAGLPTDLVWLSMIESGHNPTIASPAGAVGLWQFMPESGKMYGLTVDRWVDERRDPARSTQAAIRFLGDLYRRFGNWELAMGAYNMGYAGMSRAVEKYNTNDYWTLSRLESGIPWETTLYVPKIFALAIVMNNREAFGVGRQKLDSAETFDTILLSPATPLKAVASAAGMTLDQLKDLNSHYLEDRLPPQTPGEEKKWRVRVPSGRAKTTLAKMNGSGGKLHLHRIRLGDTPQTVADDYGVTLGALSRENGLDRGEVLAPGTVLVLPSGAKDRTGKSVVDVVVSRELHPARGQRIVYYQVRDNDQLADIADGFGVSEADLTRWNRLSATAHLREGMTLQVLVDEQASLDMVRFIGNERARVFLAGSSEFHEHFEGLKGKKRVQIVVRAGDTLAGIGKRYGMTVGSMERVNRRSRNTELIPGEHLIVYTDRKVSPADVDDETAALPPLEAPRPDLLPKKDD